MKLTKKVLSMILAAVMVLGLLPVAAFATQTEYVYITISDEGQFIEDPNSQPMAYRAVELNALSSIDLDAYGMSAYQYDADFDGEYEITALHLFIYVHEQILGLDWSDIDTSNGFPGSLYFTSGLFGYCDENLRYDYNGVYPANEYGWGTTADNIVLQPGDFLDVAHYSDWQFYYDTAYGFHYFTDDSEEIAHNFSVEAGSELTSKLILVSGGLGMPSITSYEPYYTVYYGRSIGSAVGTVETDDDGKFSITLPTAGIWYIWCEGGEGIDMCSGSIVSSPCCAVVEVIAAAGHSYGQWNVVLAPTFTQEGVQEKICSTCGDIVREVLPVATCKVEQWNITLTDALQVNFYLSVSESVVPFAKVQIESGDAVILQDVKKLAKTENNQYILSVKMAAAQMTDDITVSVVANDSVGGIFRHTIREYALTVLNDPSLGQYHHLVKEMLHYGAVAQVYFHYRESDLADKGITGTGLQEIPQTSDATYSVGGYADGVSLYGFTLSYRDHIALRYYLDITGDVDQYEFYANGVLCTPILKNGLYYVEVADIFPEELDQVVELNVFDASGNVMNVSYSPMDYITRMGQKGSENLKDLLKALYNYHLAAKELESQI